MLTHLCDASAGVFDRAVVDRGVLTVGEDEHNELHQYALDGSPLARLTLPMGPREVDIEGATLRADGSWWVGSHDRGKDTEPKPGRQHLFRVPPGAIAPDIDRTDVLALMAAPADFAPVLAATAGHTSKDVSGFSIEALHGDADGLWIGLRAPIVDGKAQLVHLADPAGAARIDRVVAVDLGGRGFRALEAHQGALYVAAGPAADEGDFALFVLDGLDTAQPVATPVAIELGSLRPEGLVSTPQGLLLLSDDGGVKIGGTSCKKLPATERRARTAWVDLP